MIPPLSLLSYYLNQVLLLSAFAAPEQTAFTSSHTRFYDVQGHRGGRGNTIENSLPSFAWGLIDGATTLELDNGITKDGVVVVWHDQNVTPAKCQDTAPAEPNDPDFPYVGKFIANLTLAQLKTVDCGSKRQHDFPMQLTYPGTKISTLQEVFDFVSCADPAHQIMWNIESKINPQFPNRTLGVEAFVKKQHALFAASPYHSSITYQSFDWRTLVAMKNIDPHLTTSALIDDETATTSDNSTTPWLAGLRLDQFPGPTFDEQVAQAAHFIGADILSPIATSERSASTNPEKSGYISFTTRLMISAAHKLGMAVKPWTVNGLNVVEQLLDWDADGIITDYPNVVRRLIKYRGLPAAPKYPKQRVLACLKTHLEKQGLDDNHL